MNDKSHALSHILSRMTDLTGIDFAEVERSYVACELQRLNAVAIAARELMSLLPRSKTKADNQARLKLYKALKELEP